MTIVIAGASRGIGAGLTAAYTARGEDVIGTTRAGPHTALLPKWCEGVPV